jgi:hypothetical protein
MVNRIPFIKGNIACASASGAAGVAARGQNIAVSRK